MSEQEDKPIFHRLSTVNEHVSVLKAAFYEAEKSILITSLDIDSRALETSDLYQLIPLAHKHGIRMYFYYNDQKGIEAKVTSFLARNGVQVSPAYTHSKILAVDHKWAALGSFNWLSRRFASYDGSIMCQGAFCESLIEDFWRHLKYYRNIQFDNLHQLKKFERYEGNYDSIVYDIDRYSTLTYIPTLEQHGAFFNEIFHIARQKIIVCSPFISSQNEFLVDINKNDLQMALDRGIEIFFVCSNDDPYLKNVEKFLDPLRSRNLHLITQSNFHLKTVIVDDRILAEGSFNWLSAIRDEHSVFHNHEATFVIEGHQAENLISHFYQSGIGRSIFSIKQHAHKKRKMQSPFFDKHHDKKTRRQAPVNRSPYRQFQPTILKEEQEIQKVLKLSLEDF